MFAQSHIVTTRYSEQAYCDMVAALSSNKPLPGHFKCHAAEVCFSHARVLLLVVRLVVRLIVRFPLLYHNHARCIKILMFANGHLLGFLLSAWPCL